MDQGLTVLGGLHLRWGAGLGAGGLAGRPLRHQLAYAVQRVACGALRLQQPGQQCLQRLQELELFGGAFLHRLLLGLGHRLGHLARGGDQVDQLRRHARGGVGIGAACGLAAQELLAYLLPAGAVLVAHLPAQLGELEQVLLGARGQHLRFALVVVGQHLLHFLVVHHRGDFFGQLVHVAVAALQPEGRLGAVAVVLRGALDVLLVDLEHQLAHLHHAGQHGLDLAQLGR